MKTTILFFLFSLVLTASGEFLLSGDSEIPPKVYFRLSLTISVVTALWSRFPVVVLQIVLIPLKSRPTFQFIQRTAIRSTRLFSAMDLLRMEPVVTDAVLFAPPLIFPSAKYKVCHKRVKKLSK